VKDEENPHAPHKPEVFLEVDEEEEPTNAWRDGKVLMVRKGAALPDRCLKCNAPADGYRFTRNLTWLHPNWVIVFLLSPIIYVIIYLILCARGKVSVGVCPEHRKKRTRAILWGWLIALAGVGSFFAAGALPENLVPVAIIGGFVLLFAGLIIGAVKSRILVTKQIDKHFIYLTKVSPDYLATWPEWKL
jgi:hypothetical protein